MSKVGIEIEFMARGISKASILSNLRAMGLSVEDRSHTHHGHSMTSWNLKRDGSVTGGFELVSPPLDFENANQRQQITTAVQALQNAGCKTGERAGIHVHVDGNDLTAKQVAAVGRFFYKFEDQIFRLATSGWKKMRSGGASYCKPLPEATAKALATAQNEHDLAKAWYGETDANRLQYRMTSGYDNSRYYGVNIHSWFYRRTIEFRVFNSSMNPNRVQMYVALCHAIVQDARNGFRRSTGKAFRLGDMKAGRVNADAAILRLQQVLTTNSNDTRRCMSKDDWKLVRKYWKDAVPQARFA